MKRFADIRNEYNYPSTITTHQIINLVLIRESFEDLVPRICKIESVCKKYVNSEDNYISIYFRYKDKNKRVLHDKIEIHNCILDYYWIDEENRTIYLVSSKDNTQKYLESRKMIKEILLERMENKIDRLVEKGYFWDIDRNMKILDKISDSDIEPVFPYV